MALLRMETFSEDMRKIFEPVTAQIFKLINEQIISAVEKKRRKPKASGKAISSSNLPMTDVM
jgi:hypothetical protein